MMYQEPGTWTHTWSCLGATLPLPSLIPEAAISFHPFLLEGLGMAMGTVSCVSPEAGSQSGPHAPAKVCIPHEYSCAEGTCVALTVN